ncbi:MAG: helix-turn-helix domain-containing protein [Propionibacteriaceae bacterium]|nr:helix-turn-helix domain-containing protein [Propionibacteriaceae bacterium]
MDGASETTRWWTRRAFMDSPARMALIAAEVRQQHGWTVQELATRAGVPVGTVTSIESGQATPINISQVHQVFRTLEVKILALPSSLVQDAT